MLYKNLLNFCRNAKANILGFTDFKKKKYLLEFVSLEVYYLYITNTFYLQKAETHFNELLIYRFPPRIGYQYLNLDSENKIPATLQVNRTNNKMQKTKLKQNFQMFLYNNKD